MSSRNSLSICASHLSSCRRCSHWAPCASSFHDTGGITLARSPQMCMALANARGHSFSSARFPSRRTCSSPRCAEIAAIVMATQPPALHVCSAFCSLPSATMALMPTRCISVFDLCLQRACTIVVMPRCSCCKKLGPNLAMMSTPFAKMSGRAAWRRMTTSKTLNVSAAMPLLYRSSPKDAKSVQHTSWISGSDPKSLMIPNMRSNPLKVHSSETRLPRHTTRGPWDATSRARMYKRWSTWEPQNCKSFSWGKLSRDWMKPGAKSLSMSLSTQPWSLAVMCEIMLTQRETTARSELNCRASLSTLSTPLCDRRRRHHSTSALACSCNIWSAACKSIGRDEHASISSSSSFAERPVSWRCCAATAPPGSSYICKMSLRMARSFWWVAASRTDSRFGSVRPFISTRKLAAILPGVTTVLSTTSTELVRILPCKRDSNGKYSAWRLVGFPGSASVLTRRFSSKSGGKSGLPLGSAGFARSPARRDGADMDAVKLPGVLACNLDPEPWKLCDMAVSCVIATPAARSVALISFCKDGDLMAPPLSAL
mmetsp:Transcript_75345/g.230481  ORF Transcript_75345/g.230481 Transcript_75345/m.230481 type:complete len:542 (-) Transcript_75345:359-1984(-)